MKIEKIRLDVTTKKSSPYKAKKIAWEYFIEKYGIQKKGNVLHHKDVNLKYTDNARYEEWRIEDLVVMDKIEHRRLHMRLQTKGKPHTKQHNQKIAEAMKENATHGKIVKITKTVELYFKNLKEAAEYIGCSRQLVSQCLRECQNNKKAKGYKIELVDAE